MTDIVIPLFEGATQLDFTGPHQFLATVPATNVIVASIGGVAIQSDGLTFGNLGDLEAIERCDVLLIPGGLGCVAAIEDARFMAEIRRLAGTARYLCSVCTGSIILAATGHLKGRRAACHWAWRHLLAEFDAIPDPARVVRDGHVISGGGVTAGIDFALALIAELHDAETAQFVQLLREYAPAPPFDAGLPERAPPQVREAVLARMSTLLADGEKRVRAVATRLDEQPSQAAD